MSNKSKTRAERAADLLSFYTIDELAQSMNVSKTTVRNWVKGESQPNNKNFQKIYRREYYWTKGERSETVKRSRGVKNETVTQQSYELFDLIRNTQSGDFKTSDLDGNKFIDLKTVVIDQQGAIHQKTLTFVNPGSGKVDPGAFESFLYREFRNQIDIYDGSDISIFVENIIV